MNRYLVIPLALSAIAPGLTFGQILFTESFDSGAEAKVFTTADPDTVTTYIDYSNFSVSGTTHALPEAPNQLPGSAPTRGVLIQANLASGNPSAVNLIAAEANGGTPIDFTGDHKLSFDMFLSNGNAAGTTEAGLFGIGGLDPDLVYNAAFSPPLRDNPDYTAAWGWLTTEGGNGTSSADAALWDGGFGVVTLENGTSASLWADAFSPSGSPIATAPNGQWVHVEIFTVDDLVTVRFNGIPFIVEQVVTSTEGHSFIGYADPWGSIAGNPGSQWGLFDNMVVEVAFRPTIAVTRNSIFGATSSTTPVSVSFTVENLNSSPLTVSELNLSGPDFAEFAVTNTLPLVIGPNNFADIIVQWTPGSDTGPRSAVLEIVSDDPRESSIEFNLSAELAPIVLAHYPLDEDEGPTVFDASPNGFDGIYEERDPILFSRPPLASGTAVSLEEAGSDLTSGNLIILPAIPHTPSLSISAWINPSADGTPTDVLFNRNPGFADSDGLFGLYLNDFGELNFAVRNQLILFSDADAITDGTPYHVAVTHLDEDGFGNDTATRSRLYINGDLVDERTGFETYGYDAYPPGARAPGMYVGSRAGAGSGYSGVIDDIQIFSTELTPEQVAFAFANPGVLATGAETTSVPLNITAVSRDSVLGDISISFTSSRGKTYAVQTSNDLSVWVGDGPSGIIPDASGLTTVSVDAPSGGQRFLRIVEE